MSDERAPPAAYSREQVARLTGLAESRLQAWARRGFYAPEHARSGLYSFVDLVALSVLQQLHERGVPARDIRDLAGWLRAFADQHPNPWASLRLRTYGRGAIIQDPEGHGLWVSARPVGQLSAADDLNLPFEDVARRVRVAAEKLAKRDREQIGQTQKSRGVQSSARVIAGTRIPTSAIAELSGAGYSVDEILREYPRLKAADVRAALQAEKEDAA